MAIKLNKIYQEDCLRTLKRMDDQSIDLVVTSPPYNMNWRIHGTDDKVDPGRYGSRQVTPEMSTKYVNEKGEVTFADNMPWEEYNVFHSQVLSELLRVSDLVFYNIQIVTGSKRSLFKMIGDFHTYLKDIIIWDKGHAEPARQKNVMNSRYEFVLVFENDYPKSRMFRNSGNFDRGELDDLWTIPRERSFTTSNAAIFPKTLVAKILNNFSQFGDSVYDPFMGTGTTAVVACCMGRKYLGSEISKEYVNICEQRLLDESKGLIPMLSDGSVNKQSDFYQMQMAKGLTQEEVSSEAQQLNCDHFLGSLGLTAKFSTVNKEKLESEVRKKVEKKGWSNILTIDQIEKEFEKIRGKWIPCDRPDSLTSDGAAGSFLEDLLGIPDNSRKGPDHGGWEIKSRSALTTAAGSLGSLSPSHPFLSNNWMRDQWGKPSDKYPNVNVLNASLLVDRPRNVYGRYSMSLKLADSEKRMYLVVEDSHTGLTDQQIYFDYSAIRDSVVKLHNTLFVKYRSITDDDLTSPGRGAPKFSYDEAVIYMGFDFDKFMDLLRRGKIQFDLRFGTRSDGSGGGKSKNRGNAFRLITTPKSVIDDYSKLYSYYKYLR